MCLCREGVVVYGGSVGVKEGRERWVVLFICVCLEDWAVFVSVCAWEKMGVCVCLVEKGVCNCVYRCWD